MVLNEELEHVRDYVLNAFGVLTAEQLTWKPRPDKWSIAECLDHIINTNTKYFPVFESIINRRYRKTFWQSINPFRKKFESLLLKTTAPLSEKKYKTMKVFAPATHGLDADLIKNFVEHQDKLIEYFVQLKKFRKQNIIISSPASSFFTYSLSVAMQVIVQHESRHIKQANNVLHHSDFPE